MKLSSVLTGGSLGRKGPTRCFCGEKPMVVMSRTTDNPGKRFYSCPNYWVGNKCRFFEWCDDEICLHGKVLIPKQRQWIITLEAQIASCKRREKFLVGMLALSLVIYGICLRVIMSLVR